MNELAARNTIIQLQEFLESVPNYMTTDGKEFTDHFFAPGIYLRTLFIPKGNVIVGAIHKNATLNILLKGKISVLTSKGERIIAKAPYIFVAASGQKAGYAIDNVWYACIFPNPNNITDIKQLEHEYTVSTYNELEALS